MLLPPGLNAIEGAQKLFDWFGYWPSFHDAEVVKLHLNRSKPSSLVIHTWESTGELNDSNHYMMTKHLVVEFILIEVLELDLSGFNSQNALSELGIEKCDAGFRLSLGPCYGLAGTIAAKEVQIRLKPGKPSDVDH
jgi:hypothetical protein